MALPEVVEEMYNRLIEAKKDMAEMEEAISILSELRVPHTKQSAELSKVKQDIDRYEKVLAGRLEKYKNGV